jgi:hypothetical protein
MLLHAAASKLGQKLLNPPNVKGWEEGPAWISTATLIARGNYAGLMLGVIEPSDVISDEDLMASELAMEAGMERGSDSMDPSMGGATTEGEGYVGDESMDPSMEPTMDPAMDGRGAPNGKAAAMPPDFRAWTRAASSTWRSGLNLSARVQRARARTDAQVVDVLLSELLAIQAGPTTRETVLEYFRTLRNESGIAEGRWRAEPEAFESILRRTAHLVLSLPEAQLS